MDLDIVRVRCFTEVAERGTVAAAANALGYSGPAVSQQIAKLEGQLQAKLFDRVGGRLKLSDHGQAFRPHALAVLESVERARRSVIDPELERSPVRVVGFPSAVAFILAPALSGWFDESADPAVTVREAEDDIALRDLGLGHADIAIVQEYSHVPTERSDRFTYTPVAADPLTLIVPPDRAGSIGSLADLQDDRWIVSGPGTPCEAATTRACSDAGFAPNIVAETTDNTAALALVAVGAGVALVPSLVLSGCHDQIAVAAIDVGISRDILAVVRPTGPTTMTDSVIAAIQAETTRSDSQPA